MNCKTDNLVPRAHLFSALLVALALASLTLTGCSGKKGQTASGLSTPAAAASQTQTAESGLSSAPASEAPASEASASSLPGPSAESVVSSSPEAAEAAPAYKPGDPGPNGGLVYFAQDGEFYEVFPPQAAVGVNDALPAGWVTPDMEDMTLIYGAVQKSGAADYGAHWYMSVSKAGGKNQYFRFSDGQNTTAPAGSGAATGSGATAGGVRKIGVRVFDPSAAPAPALLAESAFVKNGGETAATTTAAAGTTAAAPAGTAIAVGDSGPNGSIVFSASGRKYKIVTKPQNALKDVEENYPVKQKFTDAGWKPPTVDEFKVIYKDLQKTGKADFGTHWYVTSPIYNYNQKAPNITTLAAAAAPEREDFPGFPGYSIVLVGGGPGSFHIARLSDGKVTTVWQDVVIVDGEPTYSIGKNEWVPLRYVYVKEVSAADIASAAPAAKPVATTTTTAPATAAKVYKVGDKGPGGGTVFSAAGGVYKEASPLITTLDPAALGYTFFEATLVNTVKEYRGGGFSDWKIPTIEELRLVYAVRQAADFGAGWVASGTGKRYDGKGVMLQTTGITLTLNDGVIDNSSDDFPGFPGYRIVLAGGGPNTYRCINFGTGEEGGWYDEGVMLKGTGPTGALNVVAVRTFK